MVSVPDVLSIPDEWGDTTFVRIVRKENGEVYREPSGMPYGIEYVNTDMDEPEWDHADRISLYVLAQIGEWLRAWLAQDGGADTTEGA